MNSFVGCLNNHWMCIYRLVSPSGKSYIGQVKDFNRRNKARINDYYKWVRNKGVKRCSNPKLFEAFLKYGIENFQYEIIEENIENFEKLNNLEIYYIDFYDCVKHGYNILAGGNIFGGLNPETGRGYSYCSSTKFQLPRG